MTGIINFGSTANREIRGQAESLTLTVIFRNFTKFRKWNSLLISYLQKSISIICGFLFVHSVSLVGRCFLIAELPGPAGSYRDLKNVRPNPDAFRVNPTKTIINPVSRHFALLADLAVLLFENPSARLKLLKVI